MEIKTDIDINLIKKVSNIRKEDIDIADLMASIEAQGLLQPIVVSKVGGGYKIVAGHRRYLACKKLGHKIIPAVVQSFKNADIIQLTENMQRVNMSKIEESAVIFRTREKLQCSNADMSRHLGRDATWIRKRIAFHEVRQYLIKKQEVPFRSINTLTFDIALLLYSHPRSLWTPMAAKSLGKRWYPEDLKEEFKSIADPKYTPPKKNEYASAPEIGGFTITADGNQSIIKLLFSSELQYKKMVTHLKDCGGIEL